MEVQLKAGTQTLVIFSHSQGEAPWGIHFGNRFFVSDAPELSKSFGPLAAEIGLNKPLPYGNDLKMKAEC